MIVDPDRIEMEWKAGRLVVRLIKIRSQDGGCTIEETHYTREVAEQLRDKLNFLFPIRETIISPALKSTAALKKRK